jgi:hypothetical protein
MKYWHESSPAHSSTIGTPIEAKLLQVVETYDPNHNSTRLVRLDELFHDSRLVIFKDKQDYNLKDAMGKTKLVNEIVFISAQERVALIFVVGNKEHEDTYNDLRTLIREAISLGRKTISLQYDKLAQEDITNQISLQFEN